MKAKKRKFTAEEITRAAFNAAITQVLQPDDAIPKGFHSSAELSEMLHKGRATIWFYINALVAKGKMEVRKFHRRDRAGRMQCHNYYRLT